MNEYHVGYDYEENISAFVFEQDADRPDLVVTSSKTNDS